MFMCQYDSSNLACVSTCQQEASLKRAFTESGVNEHRPFRAVDENRIAPAAGAKDGDAHELPIGPVGS